MTVGRTRRALRLAPALIVPWAVLAFLSARITGIGPPGETLWGAALRATLIGLLIGSAAAWLESGPLARWGRVLPLWASLAVRTLSYALVVLAALASLIAVGSWIRARASLLEAIRSAEFQRMVSEDAFWVFLGLLMVSSFMINFGLQLRRVLGPETLRALFLGTYRRPTREQRAFVFLDLTDSTAIAERLGPLAFTEFKNDFFGDVAEPVLATGGRIVQYVGDEVMVSWPMARALKDGAPLRFVWLVEDRIAAQAERYAQRHGCVPAFKAGVHGGEVVTAEVGDLKRDIVHSGDVVNTAARIEGECRPRGERLLVSEWLLSRMSLPEKIACYSEHIGNLPLRGKAEPVGVVAVHRGEAVRRAD